MRCLKKSGTRFLETFKVITVPSVKSVAKNLFTGSSYTMKNRIALFLIITLFSLPSAIQAQSTVYLPVIIRQVETFNFNEAMAPFWLGSTMYNESVLMVSSNGVAPEASFLFTPITILSVKNSHLNIEYTAGIEWIYENGKLKLLPGARAPFMTMNDLYPVSCTVWVDCFYKVGEGYVLWQEGHYFHDRQLAVTYTHSGIGWNGPVPQFAGTNLPNTISKLQSGSPLKIILYGDSIAIGFNASGVTGFLPYLPGWGDLIVRKLRENYSSTITSKNPSVSGVDSEWGKANAASLVTQENSDLVIIAFGMNDGTRGVPPGTFKNNVAAIMADVKTGNPSAEFILVAPMLPNAETYFYGQQLNYKQALQELTTIGVVLSDMTGVHQELLTYKKYSDMTGNNINHPNDFLIRWYAQVISALLIN